MDANQLVAAAVGAALGSVLTAATLAWWRRSGPRTAAHLDPLTGVADRGRGARRIARLRTGDAVVMVDVDHFKAVNEIGGHPHGDALLRAVGTHLAGSVRGDDLVIRWGGDEFLVVLAGAEDTALSITERIHARWADTAPAASFSAGVAVHVAGSDPSSTVAAADAALFRAKRAGRDCVASAD